MKMTMEKVDGRWRASKSSSHSATTMRDAGPEQWSRTLVWKGIPMRMSGLAGVADRRGGLGAHRTDRRGISGVTVRPDGRSVERAVLPRFGTVQPQRGP